jgi:hypothetical protein
MVEVFQNCAHDLAGEVCDGRHGVWVCGVVEGEVALSDAGKLWAGAAGWPPLLVVVRDQQQRASGQILSVCRGKSPYHPGKIVSFHFSLLVVQLTGSASLSRHRTSQEGIVQTISIHPAAGPLNDPYQSIR